MRRNFVAISDKHRFPGIDGRALVNKPRAYAVMEEMRVDGLVALNPLNVYYLSNTLTTSTRFRADFAAFATFPRDEREPAFLITDAMQALELANGEREVPQMIAVSGIADWEEEARLRTMVDRNEPKAATPGFAGTGGFAVAMSSALTAAETRWVDAQRKQQQRAAPTLAWGLARALKESGLDKARLAVDDMRIAYLLAEVGLKDVTCVAAAGLFQRIRMVKSDVELALMRVAGKNNARAAMATIESLEVGMRHEEIERQFRVEAAALGNEISSLITGVSIAGFPDGETVRGKPFLVDAVSHFLQYHGDFGRTVVIGEPSKDILARARAHAAGREAVFEIIRPGVRFSELRRIAEEAQVKAGLRREIVIVNPHSVGLQHDDNPWRMDLAGGAPTDHVLEENMVLTVDLANVEIGWGAAHHEDMFRVTRSGYEALHPEGEPLVIV